MFGFFQKARISTKLTGTVGAALVSLCVMGTIAVFAARTIESLGHDLYVQSSQVSSLQMKLAVSIERAIGAVYSAPSELDLVRLKATRARFSVLLAESSQILTEKPGGAGDPPIRAGAEEIARRLTAFGAEANKVFDLSEAFAQPDAIAMLAQNVAPAEVAMLEAQRQFRHVADQYESAQMAALQATSGTVTGVVIGLAGTIVVAISALAYIVVSRGVVRPINAVNRRMTQLADGDTAAAVPHAGRPDEIGAMARAVEVFQRNMISAQRLSAQQAAARAARARRQEAMELHTAEFGTSVSEVMATLAASSSGMGRAADAMADTSAAVHKEAAATSGGAAKSSEDLTAVAAAVEQLTSSFQEISRQVSTASGVSRDAVRQAEAGQDTIRSLTESTSRIGDVVRLINDIAGRTNLLALNATIEAARAGDAGRGFAVVAGEVKALAAQTAKATQEIAGQIDTVRAATEATIAAMTEIGGMIGQMDQVSAAIAAAVEQQSATTREIASNVQAVSGATVRSARAMGHVVVVADQAGAASQQVLAGAADIGHQAETLRAKVDRFLAAIRTDSGDRRRFERIAGENISAMLLLPGQTAIPARVHDISQGGIALMCDRDVIAGVTVSVELPDAGGAVTGKVIRSEGGALGIEFGEDDATRARVDRAVAALSKVQRAA